MPSSSPDAPQARSAQAIGWLVLRVALGVFLIDKGLGKLPWLFESAPLAHRLTEWAARENVAEISRWYAHLLIGGAPLFARLSLLGELGGGVALVLGFRTREVAALSALMILNYHLASGGLIVPSFISEANGLATVGALIALAIGARNLPYSLTG